MQNITKLKILASDETAPSTKAIVSKKRLDVSMKKISYTIS